MVSRAVLVVILERVLGGKYFLDLFSGIRINLLVVTPRRRSMYRKLPRMSESMVAEEKRYKQALSVLLAGCPKLILAENRKLFDSISLIRDLIAWGGIDRYLTLRSVIEELNTDWSVAKELSKDVDRSNRYCNRPAAVLDLVEYLNYWLLEGHVKNSTTLIGAQAILVDRLEKNQKMLALG